MVSATLPTSTLSGSMRRYGRPARPASHWVSISRSSGLPSLSRVMATAANRTSGACLLSAWAQRAMVRCASAGEITPSRASHSITRLKSSGPWWAAGAGVVAGTDRGEALMSQTWALNTRSHLGAGNAQRVCMVWRALGKLGALGAAGRALCQHHRVAFARRPEGPDRLGPEGGDDLLQAPLVAGGAAEEVDRHAAIVGQQASAVAIEVLRIKNGRSRLVVVQVDLQRIDAALPLGLADFQRGIGHHHAQFGVVGRQLEPAAAGRDDLRVEFDRGGAHAQLLAAELGERGRAQAQLHGMAVHHAGGFDKEQPGHHALHVFELDLEGRIELHRALHPFRAQVQIAHIAPIGEVDFG